MKIKSVNNLKNSSSLKLNNKISNQNVSKIIESNKSIKMLNKIRNSIDIKLLLSHSNKSVLNIINLYL